MRAFAEAGRYTTFCREKSRELLLDEEIMGHDDFVPFLIQFPAYLGLGSSLTVFKANGFRV